MRSAPISLVAASCAAFALLAPATGPVSAPLSTQMTGEASLTEVDLLNDGLVTSEPIAPNTQREVSVEAPPTTQTVSAMDPIYPMTEPLILPVQLVLRVAENNAALDDRYGQASDEELVRQQVRIQRLVVGQYVPEAMPAFKQHAITELLLDVDALNHELQWIQSQLSTRRVARDPGFKLLTPKTAVALQDELKGASREDLAVAEWKLDRQRILEEGRASDLLIHQGRYVDEPSQMVVL